MKVTNLDADPYRKEPHPKRTLAQHQEGVNKSVLHGTEPHVEVVHIEGKITDSMRAGYDRFWQLLIGRKLDKDPDP